MRAWEMWRERPQMDSGVAGETRIFEEARGLAFVRRLEADEYDGIA